MCSDCGKSRAEAVFLTENSSRCRGCLDIALKAFQTRKRGRKRSLMVKQGNRIQNALFMHCYLCGKGLANHAKDCKWNPKKFTYMDLPQSAKHQSTYVPKERWGYVCLEYGHKFISNLPTDKVLCPFDRGAAVLYVPPQL